MREINVRLALFLTLCAATRIGAADFDIKAAAEFAKIVPTDASVQKLASGMKFIEGPVWIADGNYLVFSDIPGDELKKWDGQTLTTFRKPSHGANGNTLDLQGRLITCEHQSRRVTRTEKDGTITILAETFNGKKLNSPNDAIVKSDGSIWFTDPPYGLPGGKGKEQPLNFVFRLNPETKELKAVADDFDMPNGLCFSPDEKKLYIADSGKPVHIRVFDVNADGTLANGKVFCKIDKGLPDGIRCDSAGRIFSSAGEGVQIFSPDGALIGKILVPESPANLCFGGAGRKTLFMTARTSLYSIQLSVAGLQR
jgi:gluconolactonase